MSTSQIMVLLLILSIYISTGNAVRCFQCTSLGGESCADPFRLSYEDTHHMATGCTYCAKKETKDAVARTCEIGGDAKEGCSSTPSLKTCICADDLCNTAPTTITPYMCLITAVFSLLK